MVRRQPGEIGHEVPSAQEADPRQGEAIRVEQRLGGGLARLFVLATHRPKEPRVVVEECRRDHATGELAQARPSRGWRRAGTARSRPEVCTEVQLTARM